MAKPTIQEVFDSVVNSAIEANDEKVLAWLEKAKEHLEKNEDLIKALAEAYKRPVGEVIRKSVLLTIPRKSPRKTSGSTGRGAAVLSEAGKVVKEAIKKAISDIDLNPIKESVVVNGTIGYTIDLNGTSIIIQFKDLKAQRTAERAEKAKMTVPEEDTE